MAARLPGGRPRPADVFESAYLYVDDALYTEYGLREGAHVDPEGNLLRFGSALP
ncbi:MAG: hypothetical protein ACRD08_14930 [Acidimicrobiales bacterium]